MPGRGAQALVDEGRWGEKQFEIGQHQRWLTPDKPVRLSDIGRQHAATPQQIVRELAWTFRGEQAVLANLKTQGRGEMVKHVLTDLGRVMLHIDAVLGEVVSIADSRKHQQLWGVDRAGAERDLAVGSNYAALASWTIRTSIEPRLEQILQT